MSSSNNRLIVKNTLFLYGQTLITLVVGLYTGRIVLDALGVVDYGIYNVVGGVITSLTFITSSLSSATTRYITYGLGKGDMDALKRTFGNILSVHFLLAGIVLLLAETIGLWFVMNKLVIPEERMSAALWVYHFSVWGFVINIISAPYNGSVIAHEKMSVFAFINIMNSLLKLLIIYAIIAANWDRLIFYAFLMLIVELSNRLIYGIYCSRHFPEVKICFSFDRIQFKEIMSYSWWMSVGNVAFMCCDQGFNILLNLFFGPVINAARGLAVMIQGQVMNLGTTFQSAMKPQIIKSYAEGDMDHMKFLMFSGTKFSFYVVYAIALPVMMGIHQFLSWWLVEVPEWTSQFTIIIIWISCVRIISVPLYYGVSATGDLKSYQTSQSLVLILFLPVAYLILKLVSIQPTYIFILLLGFHVACLLVSCIYALRKLRITIIEYCSQTIFPIISVVFCSSLMPLGMRLWMRDGVISFFVICGVALICVLVTSYYLGCNKEERSLIKEKILDKLFKRNKAQ